MHPYELKVIAFMDKLSKESVPVEDALLKPASKDVEHYLRKLYEEEPNRPFSLRMSSIGRPLCQSMMHKAGAASVPDDWYFPLRMMIGGVVEGVAIAVLKHSGVPVGEEQTHVKLTVNVDGKKVYVPGTLDLTIEGRVWDVKSASPYSYKEKFASYGSLKENDSFGYLAQLYGYSKARGLPPGGFIVIDKSSGEMKFIEVPDDYQADMDEALATIENNVKILLSNEEFRRSFTDVDETFKKRVTGNRVLPSICGFCKYKYSCWPGLKHEPSVLSTAYDKPMKYYTKLVNSGLDIVA